MARVKMRSRRQRNTWKGVVAGLLGGFAASWAMNEFQSFLSSLADKASEVKSKASAEQSGMTSSAAKSAESKEHESGDDATMKVADKLWTAATGSRLTKEEKDTAGPIVHYVFGSAMGAAYGAVVEHAPWANVGAGIPLGALLFIGADEVAVPALGLSESPAKYPLSSHMSALAAHTVYGVTTEAVRRVVRAALR